MNESRRVEKTMKISPQNYAYLSELKDSISGHTGLNVSFNDVLAMVRHRFPLGEMVERLTTKAAKKQLKFNDNE